MGQQIQTRVRIMYKEGGEIAYTTDLDVMKSLGIKEDHEFKEIHALEMDSILTFSD